MESIHDQDIVYIALLLFPRGFNFKEVVFLPETADYLKRICNINRWHALIRAANSSFSKIEATSEKLFGLFNKSTARLIHRVRLAPLPILLHFRKFSFTKCFFQIIYIIRIFPQLKRFFQVSRFWLFKSMLSYLLLPWIDIMKQYYETNLFKGEILRVFSD